MFGEIARFLLNTVFTLFGAALILRVWMQAVRVPPYNPSRRPSCRPPTGSCCRCAA
jgi:hypothetical protein